jgi:glutathione S-transferase
MSSSSLDWSELQRLSPDPLNPSTGATNAQATIRLFGSDPSSVRVTLFRDHHAWCPYCQKVWLWLEEKRIPYRVRKVTMFCYGEKEAWFKRLVPSGMLPALMLDEQVITESDQILEALEAAFFPLVYGMNQAKVLPLRHLERVLFRAWCQWLCRPSAYGHQEIGARDAFDRVAAAMAAALEAGPGPFFLTEFSTADLVFIPYVERMNASLAYYKGYLLREQHPAIDRWFRALEQRSTYLGTQSDFHTHAHDLPPQMGGCHANGLPSRKPWQDGSIMALGRSRRRVPSIRRPAKPNLVMPPASPC